MASAAEPLSVLLNTLEFCKCKTCQKVTLLKVLPCLHSFCDGCLSAPGRSRRICPVCKVTATEDPPINIFVCFLTEVEGLQSLKPCYMCHQVDGDTTDATHVCLSCCDEPRYVCKRCIQRHDICTGETIHRIVIGDEFAENGGIYRPVDSHKYCEIHTKEPIKRACERCLKMMCMICVGASDCPDAGSGSSNKRHLCDELSLTVQKCKEEISGLIAVGNESEKKARKQVEEVKKERESATLPWYQRMQDSVKDRYDAVSKALAEERGKALESIDLRTGGRLTKTDTWLNTADEYLKKLNVCYYEGERALIYSPPADVLNMTKTLRRTLKLEPSPLELKPMPELKHIHKCRDEEIGGMVQKLVGEIALPRALVVGDTVRICPGVLYGGHPYTHLGYEVSAYILTDGKVKSMNPYNGNHWQSGVNHTGYQCRVKFPGMAIYLIDTEIELA